MLVPYAQIKLVFQSSLERIAIAQLIVHCSYVPKKNRAVVLILTAHYTNAVEGAHKKPMAIMDYNKNKAGMETMDQILGTYTCKRGTKRWPLTMFYNIVDVATLASFIAYDDLNPSQ